MTAYSLPSQSTDFARWYGEGVRRTELAEHAPVRGAMVIKPYGYAIWEAIRNALDERIKATGHMNVYFPLLMPSSLLDQEAEHVEGFSPEVAVVTHAGARKLAEPLVVRPTSEAIVWSTYARWVQSHRDLPLLYNQWANVVRWELRPRLFLRTTEFLWQEGHTAHATEAEALDEALRILHEVYADTAERVLAMPVLRGRKSASERFPGAVETFSLEALMRDGKALQAGTSHYLGQNFSRAYGVRFTDHNGADQFAYATSWGASTRLIGALIMTHGDDTGLRLPPVIAPHQVVIIPIHRSLEERAPVLEASDRLARALHGSSVRAHVDDREEHRPGFKFNEWELKGVPLRADLGAREVADGYVTLARRDNGTKERVPIDAATDHVHKVLTEIQDSLLQDADAFRNERTLDLPASYGVMREFLAAATGFATAPWCGSTTCEERVQAETAATIRCLPVERHSGDDHCIVCGSTAVDRATWAQSY